MFQGCYLIDTPSRTQNITVTTNYLYNDLYSVRYNCMVCTVGMQVWEVIICVDRARVLNQCQVCAYCINFSVHPRRLFLSSKCSSMVVLNDGTGFKAIKSQNGEKKASVSCHLPRNSSDIDMIDR